MLFLSCLHFLYALRSCDRALEFALQFKGGGVRASWEEKGHCSSGSVSVSSEWLPHRPLPPDGSDHVFEANLEQLHGTGIPVSTVFIKLPFIQLQRRQIEVV